MCSIKLKKDKLLKILGKQLLAGVETSGVVTFGVETFGVETFASQRHASVYFYVGIIIWA